MRGSALYLHEGNGGPHVPPNPHCKFMQHWATRLRARAEAFVNSFCSDGLARLTSETCQPCSMPVSASSSGESRIGMTSFEPEVAAFTLNVDEVGELLERVDAWLRQHTRA